MMQTFDVAVIGLGAMGGATLDALAGRGVRVIRIERFTPGHDKGSSHGESRAIRLSDVEHPSYVPLLRSAYEGWRALDADCGETLLTITDILEAGHPGSPVVRDSSIASREHAIPHEILSSTEVSRRFPAVLLPEDWTALFQPDGGVLRPERASSASSSGHQAGARPSWRRPRSWRSNLNRKRSGWTRRAAAGLGRVVVAAGPWIRHARPWYEWKATSGRLPFDQRVWSYHAFAFRALANASHLQHRRVNSIELLCICQERSIRSSTQ